MITIEQYIAWQGTQKTIVGGTINESWSKSGINDPVNDPDLRKSARISIDRAYAQLAVLPSYTLPWEGKIVEVPPVTTIGGATPTTAATSVNASNVDAQAVPSVLKCGTAGGAVNKRDLTGLAGGGETINCVSYSYTIVGKDVHGFEWNLYAQMDNYANDEPGKRTEHCAFYAKANKYGTATNWAGCLEVHDFNGVGPCIPLELDIWTKGPDNGSRIGLDVMLAGSNDVNDPAAEVGGTAVIRGSVPDSNPLAYWSFGAWLRGIRESGVRIVSQAAGAVRGFELIGKYIVGLDLSQASCQSAIRLAPGQRMTFEPTDQISWSWMDGRLRVQNGDTNILEIDTTSGDVYKRGKKVL